MFRGELLLPEASRGNFGILSLNIRQRERGFAGIF